MSILNFTLPTIVFIIGAIILVVAVVRRFDLPQAKVMLSKIQSIVLGLIGSIFILLSVAGYIYPSIPNDTQVSTIACAPILVDETLPRISIYENGYHLGDDTRSDLSPSDPQIDPFEGTFDIEQINNKIYLQMTVKDVSPQETQQPNRIYINGIFIDFLNRYVTEERLEPTVIQIPIPKDALRVGKNNVLIFTAPYIGSSEKGVDDFEISKVGIIFK
jgi:hypothetical protein